MPVTAAHEPMAWLSVPEVAAALGIRDRDVRSMVRDRRLLAVRPSPDRPVAVPAEVVLGPEHPDGPGPLPSLRGTLTLLADRGLDDAEAFEWLYSEDDELGQTPIRALLDRRTHAVRRRAQTLDL